MSEAAQRGLKILRGVGEHGEVQAWYREEVTRAFRAFAHEEKEDAVTLNRHRVTIKALFRLGSTLGINV